MRNMPRWMASVSARVLGWTNSRSPNISTPSSGSCFLLSLEHAERSQIGAGNVTNVLRHTRLPADYILDRVPVTIIDTSCRAEAEADRECQVADAVVPTCTRDRLFTLERLSTSELRRIQLKAPVNVVGCEELRDEQQKNLEQTMAPSQTQKVKKRRRKSKGDVLLPSICCSASESRGVSSVDKKQVFGQFLDLFFQAAEERSR